MFTPGTVIANRYRVLRELGQGGMGAVYLVEHLHTGARHALKALHAHLGHRASAVERFRREARVTAQIQSEHVAQVTDADVATSQGGVPFLVMELLNGKDVEQLVRERGRLAPAEVVAIVAQASRALARAHAVGIVHRDLKPENLFYHHPPSGPPVIKVLDFGVSKALGASGAAPADVGLTAGGVVGTPLYMAPEQAIGGTVSPQADMFALGMIAFRLLAGESYWTGRTTAEVMAGLLAPLPTAPSHRVPGLPPGFDPWFARSCHLDPAGRFVDVNEQAMGLATALGMPASTIGASLSPLSHPGPQGASPAPYGPSPYEPTTASPHVTPPPMQHTPPPREDAGAPLRWLFAAVGLALVMVVSAAIAALSVGALSAADTQSEPASAPEGGEPADEPLPVPTGEPYVTSGRILGGSFLKKSNIRSVVESHRGDLLGCYRAALEGDPRLEGDLTLMITVDDFGQVSHVMASALSVPNRGLRSCCEALASDWVFLPPEGSSIGSFQYTLEFGRR